MECYRFKFDPDLCRRAPNHTARPKSTRCVKRQIDCFWNARGAAQCYPSAIHGDISHNTANDGSLTEKSGGFENLMAMKTPAFLHDHVTASDRRFYTTVSSLQHIE